MAAKNPKQSVPPINDRVTAARPPDHQLAPDPAPPDPGEQRISFEQFALRQAVEKAIVGFADCLRLAEAGEICAYAVLAISPGGQVTWKWHFGTRTQAEMIGGAHCMLFAMSTFAMTGSMPTPEPVHPPGNA